MITAAPRMSLFAQLARWLRWVLPGITAAAVVVAAVVVVGNDARDVDRRREAKDVAAYRSRLEPLVEDGAHVVGMGLRPGMTDIAEARYPTLVLEGMADSWVSELESLRAKVVALEHPAVLDDVHSLYVEAVSGYVETATAMREAVGASGEARQRLLEAAAGAGRRADRTFDRAERGLAAVDARYGEPKER